MLSGSAYMIGDTGTLPALGVGAGVGIELAWPSIELRAIGTWLPERELSDLDLTYAPPFSSPWDPIQMAAQAWQRARAREVRT